MALNEFSFLFTLRFKPLAKKSFLNIFFSWLFEGFELMHLKCFCTEDLINHWFDQSDWPSCCQVMDGIKNCESWIWWLSVLLFVINDPLGSMIRLLFCWFSFIKKSCLAAQNAWIKSDGKDPTPGTVVLQSDSGIIQIRKQCSNQSSSSSQLETATNDQNVLNRSYRNISTFSLSQR